jgi:hypothetical protein
VTGYPRGWVYASDGGIAEAEEVARGVAPAYVESGPARKAVADCDRDWWSVEASQPNRCGL